MNPRIVLGYDFSAYDFLLKPYGLLRAAAFLRGRADFNLLDYLDRLDRRVPGGNHRRDQWGRGEFYSEQTEKPLLLRMFQGSIVASAFPPKNSGHPQRR